MMIVTVASSWLSSSRRLALLILLVLLGSSCDAFCAVKSPTPRAVRYHQTPRTPAPKMSADIDSSSSYSNTDSSSTLGATERTLLEAAAKRRSNVVQKYGKTIKNDGLDGVRALVWGLFGVSQVVFGVAAVALTLTLALNVAGYGYYWDTTTDHYGLVIDALQNIHQQEHYATEMAKMAASSSGATMIP